jgi:4-hydroxybenzoate polyprenyltransferase
VPDLRRRWLAVALFFALNMVAYLVASTELWIIPAHLTIAAIYTLIVARYGLLAVAALHMTFVAVFFAPMPDALAWYTARGLMPFILIFAIAVWAFFTALGGQRAFRTNLLDD